MTTRTFILQDCDDPLNPQWRDAVLFRVAGDRVEAEDLRGQFNPQRLAALCSTPLVWSRDGEVHDVYPGEDDFLPVLVQQMGPMTHRIREVKEARG